MNIEPEDSSYNIKAIAIYNLSNKESFVEHINTTYNDNKVKLSNTCETLVDKLTVIDIKANERHTENLKYDKVLASSDSKAEWVFILISHNSYPERIGYQLLEQLKKRCIMQLSTSLIDMTTLSTRQLRDKVILDIVELEKKYRDPKKVDIIYEIQNDVNEVNKTMRKNIYNIISSTDSATELHKTSESILTGANLFENNASELKRSAAWKNKKLLIVGGTAFTGCLGYLIYSLFF